MKIFLNLMSKVYSYKKLTFKGFIRNQELSLAISEEIQIALWVMDSRRITNRSRWGRNTNSRILTFNKSMIPKKIKIVYYLKKVKQYILTSLRCFKCNKYGHHKESSKGCLTCGSCDQNGTDHIEEACPNEIKCLNCQENHLTFLRTCNIYKREANYGGEILKKHHISRSKKNSGILHKR